MATILSRLRALEPHALLDGFQLDYAASQQNGSDCWFIATISMLRKKGYRLDGFDVKCLRSRTYDWLDGRREQYRWYGEEYWKFVGNWERAWVTNLAVTAALTVLSEELQMNLEMVALSTTGSDYLEPIRSLSDCPKTVRLVYGFDPEKHYVALHALSNNDAARYDRCPCDTSAGAGLAHLEQVRRGPYV